MAEDLVAGAKGAVNAAVKDTARALSSGRRGV